MDRVNWDGEPYDRETESPPDDLEARIFDFLPEEVPLTPALNDLAQRYRGGRIAGQDYPAMQAAAFLQPKSAEIHLKRRRKFGLRAREAQEAGFAIPRVFEELVQTDAHVDRLHHHSKWLTMPDQLVRFPGDPAELVFLAFVEGQGCCNWHMRIRSDGTHSMVCCEHPMGLRTNRENRSPDYSQCVIQTCADSIEDWLYFYFQECAQHDREYLKRINDYQA